MSAIQAKAPEAAIPQRVFSVVVQAAEFGRDWPASLEILQNVLHEMRQMADRDEPLDASYVDGWRRQLGWMFQRIDDDCERLREAVKGAGYGHLVDPNHRL